jgi:hypothetical protein
VASTYPARREHEALGVKRGASEGVDSRRLRVVESPPGDDARVDNLIRRLESSDASLKAASSRQRSWLGAVSSAEERAQRLAVEVDRVRSELVEYEQRAATEAAGVSASRASVSRVDRALRYGVLALLSGLLCLMVWAAVVDYPLRVTSDTPTFIALVSGMAERPFEEQSPFLADGSTTQHATPYMQAVAFLHSFLDGDSREPVETGRLLAFVGIPVFGLTLFAIFLYARRFAGSRAAWLTIALLLGLFGPPHVIWASDLSLHAALYASFFPQNLAIALALLTLLALAREGYASLALACLGAAATMLVHPFTGVLLCALVAAWSCHLAYRGARAFVRGPIALVAGFALGALWPAYSLDRAFSETGVSGVVFLALCSVIPFGVGALERGVSLPSQPLELVPRTLETLERPVVAWWLAVVGAVGTVLVIAWEWALVRSPPGESARLAIYWVDDRWQWPLLLVAGLVGISGLATLARRGSIVPAVWCGGCLALGVLGAVGLPLPVWYRFLLLCQIPLALGVAVVVSRSWRNRTTALILATFCLAVGVKVVTLLDSSAKVSYFGSPLQPAWALGDHIPAGPGIVATDPKTAYFIPAATGHRVLTLDKGHASSRDELARAEAGYQLLRRLYVGDRDWWAAAQQMWRRGVRYVVVEKQTTLEPRTLSEFTWETSMLRTQADRRALSRYFYANNRIGKLIYDSRDYAVYRLDPGKLLVSEASRAKAKRAP